MKIFIIIHYIIAILYLNFGNQGKAQTIQSIHVRLTEVPRKPNGMFSGVIDWWDLNSTYDNPCYRIPFCYFGGAAVRPNGLMPPGYQTMDDDHIRERQGCAENNATMSAVGSCLKSMNSLYISVRDYLPAEYGPFVKFCVFRILGKYVDTAAGPMSNCEEVVRHSSCKFTEQEYHFDFGRVNEGDYIPEMKLPIHIQCDAISRGKIVVSGQRIVLGQTGYAEFDLFNGGWGNTGYWDTGYNNTFQGEIRARIINLSEIGEWQGSGILLLQPD